MYFDFKLILAYNKLYGWQNVYGTISEKIEYYRLCILFTIIKFVTSKFLWSIKPTVQNLVFRLNSTIIITQKYAGGYRIQILG